MGVFMMKGEKMTNKSSFSSRVRKRLSDITNMSSHHKSPLKDQQNFVPALDDSSSKNYVQQLLKENAAMIKLIQEKDKIIEMNGIELQKLRISLQRTQLQNLQLAQSNTHMLTELNTGRDRLKAIQHQLSLKDAWYNVKILELQEGESKGEKAALEQTMDVSNDNENKVPKSKRGRATRSQSLGSTTAQEAIDREIAENKRRCLRRQSVTLKAEETQDDFFEIDALSTPVTRKKEQPRRGAKSERTDKKEPLSEPSKQSASQRPSMGRPVRSAAKKVQSYKDPSLAMKLRRP